jgi:hypothetical protein
LSCSLCSLRFAAKVKTCELGQAKRQAVKLSGKEAKLQAASSSQQHEVRLRVLERGSLPWCLRHVERTRCAFGVNRAD